MQGATAGVAVYPAIDTNPPRPARQQAGPRLFWSPASPGGQAVSQRHNQAAGRKRFLLCLAAAGGDKNDDGSRQKDAPDKAGNKSVRIAVADHTKFLSIYSLMRSNNGRIWLTTPRICSMLPPPLPYSCSASHRWANPIAPAILAGDLMWCPNAPNAAISLRSSAASTSAMSCRADARNLRANSRIFNLLPPTSSANTARSMMPGSSARVAPAAEAAGAPETGRTRPARHPAITA